MLTVGNDLNSFIRRLNKMTATELTRLGLQPGLTSKLSPKETLAALKQNRLDVLAEIERREKFPQINADLIAASQARLRWLDDEIEQLEPTKEQESLLQSFIAACVLMIAFIAAVFLVSLGGVQ